MSTINVYTQQSLLTFAILVLASALPSALANWREDCPDIIVKELYRTVENVSDIYFDGESVAEGDNTDTDGEAEVISLDDENIFSAVFVGTADVGEVFVFNKGYGQVVNCDIIESREYKRLPFKERLCIYTVVNTLSEYCEEAAGIFEGFAFGSGENAQALIITNSVQVDGASATSQEAIATGSEGAGVNLEQTDSVTTLDSTNQATGLVDVVVDGSAAIITSVDTVATEDSSGTNVKIASRSGDTK